MTTPDPTRPPAAALRPLLLAAFFLSGAVALTYEVAWSRALLLLMGSTAAASAVVLAVFVGGLGLGARWGGRRAERSPRPLMLYGLFEVGAAAWAVLAPFLTHLLQDPYVAVAAGAPGWVQMVLRVLVAVVIVGPAAFLLGATLPAMVRHWVRQDGDTGRQTAWLYGANTVGAFVGCLFTGYVGVARFGVQGVVVLGAAIGGAVGVAAMLLAREAREVGAAPEGAAPARRAPTQSVALAQRVALLCGFIGLATEVAGFRILVFFLEGFTVTFASMLGVFIAGLGIGSLVLGPVLARTRRPARVLGVLLLLQAATLLFGLYVVVPSLEGWMHGIRDLVYEGAGSPGDIAAGLRIASLLGAALFLLVPAILMGPTFPLCVRWAELGGESPGHAVGRIYLWNSAGSVLAPFLVTFAVVPLFHVTGAWVLLVVGAAVTGANLLLLHRWSRTRVWSISFSALLAAALAVGVLVLDPAGTRATDLVEQSVVVRGTPGRTLLRLRSDAVTTASVIETAEGERYLYTDDFAAAATGRHYRYMRMLGHLPCILAKDPRNVMVIAFGTGTTAGAVAGHEDVERIEVVEVSDAVLDLASHFLEANRNVLSDPRVVPVADDGRNALLLHEPDLDVITLEPLMPYSPQGYPFYTREFYELARDRLTDGGVVCQWIPVHAMPVGLYAAFLRTFFEVFPGGTLWFFEQSTVLIGRKGTAQPDAGTVTRRLLHVGEDLQEAGFENPQLFRSGYVARGREILALEAPTSPGLSASGSMTDAHPYAEFEPTPRAPLNTPYLHQTLKYLFSLVEPTKVPAGVAGVPDAHVHGATQLALAARWKEAEADFLAVSMRNLPRSADGYGPRMNERMKALEDAARAYNTALRIVPGERVLRWREVRVWRKIAALRLGDLLEAMRSGDEDIRRRALSAAEELTRNVLPPAIADPDPVATRRVEAVAGRVAVLLRLGRCAEARRALEEARVDLADERREGPVNELLDAVIAHMEGGPVTVPEGRAWVFEDRAPCREEGTAPVKGELEAFGRAMGTLPLRLQRSAAKRLADAAVREGVAGAVLAALIAPAGEAPEPAALRAALRRALDPEDGTLASLLASAEPEARAVALREAGWWGFLHLHPDVMEAARKDEDARVRKALATAAAKRGQVEVLRVVRELLMDADLDVRSEAFSVFLKFRPDEIKGYDPKGTEAERRAAYEALEASLR